MPGILPMKVIKVGSSTQSRIAQACDRCRSKKIRCDGIRPCCTQCANVGFECRTSDKLSRRAFPRGYTESLEERVRILEAEVRDLKDLLDEKDEKIDVLSKIHGNRCRPPVPTVDTSPANESSPPREDTFRVQASPLLLGVENSDSCYMGPSSGRAFIGTQPTSSFTALEPSVDSFFSPLTEFFKRRLQEAGKPCSGFHPEAFLHIQGCRPLLPRGSAITTRLPPRLFSDRCVNVYFQEWAPLFPVLHKPSFLQTYEDWVAEPDKAKSHHKLAQLYLVFSIAALSTENPDLEQVATCELQWQRSLQAILMDDTMDTLQCLVLALTYCQIRVDHKRLQHYKSLAVGLSHRLGLHQSQKRFSFGALTIETRKKVFWALYTLDCFSAATLGLPKLIKEDDVHTEYPNDIDDEYVTEKGFLPTLPGESTRLSGALALFRASRILAKVLEKIYPAATTHELSLQQMSALAAELDEWSNSLPSHLKLTFKQDKPSTDITGSRSPLLAIAYHHIRTLIYRPAVGSSLGAKAAPAVMSVSDSSKHLVQICQLLEERSMSFSFCLNKAHLLVSCGMALLYQGLELKQESKLWKENEKVVNTVVRTVGRMKAPVAYDFRWVANLVIKVDDEPARSLPTPPGQHSPGPNSRRPPPKRGLPVSKPKKKSSPQDVDQPQQFSLGRHSSVSETATRTPPGPREVEAQPCRSPSRSSFDSARPNTASFLQRRDQRLSMSQAVMQKPNLNYLTLGNPVTQQHSPLSPVHNNPDISSSFYTHVPKAASTSGAEHTALAWDALFDTWEEGQGSLYESMYCAPQLSVDTPVASSAVDGRLSPESLDLSTFHLGDFGIPGHGSSLREESLSSVSGGDEFPSLNLPDFSVDQGGTMSHEGFVLDGVRRGSHFL